MIALLAGGVGAARFACGAVEAFDDFRAIVNTGDDVVLHGLHVSPDLDTMTYTLAGVIDKEKGWGLAGETWQAMDALRRFAAVTPDSSTAGATWFGLGDRDLATHFYRTQRLAEGSSLTVVTSEISRAFGVNVPLIPMSDDRVETRIVTTDGSEIGFQDYFVALRHDVPITGIRFSGADRAKANPLALDAISTASAIVIAPSNPLVSIGPIRELAGIDEALSARRESVVAVSPIVGGKALKGPADRMLTELGHEQSVVGVARLYRDIAATLIIDHVDASLASAVERQGMRVVVTDTIMSSPGVSARLARTAVEAIS